MSFEKGRKKTGGRAKGTPNKISKKIYTDAFLNNSLREIKDGKTFHDMIVERYFYILTSSYTGMFDEKKIKMIELYLNRTIGKSK